MLIKFKSTTYLHMFIYCLDDVCYECIVPHATCRLCFGSNYIVPEIHKTRNDQLLNVKFANFHSFHMAATSTIINRLS